MTCKVSPPGPIREIFGGGNRTTAGNSGSVRRIVSVLSFPLVVDQNDCPALAPQQNPPVADTNTEPPRVTSADGRTQHVKRKAASQRPSYFS
jgi:hypothetical protein